MIWLRPADKALLFQIPKTALFEREENIWFVRLEKTWLALRPINLRFDSTINLEGKRYSKIYAGETVFRCLPQGEGFTGFVLEVGSGGNYATFKRESKRKARLDVNGLSKGEVKYQGIEGNILEFTYNKSNLLPLVKRNGRLRDWGVFDLYKNSSGAYQPVSLGWKQGNLRVRSQDYLFTQTLP